jgi:hypothetical protein
MANGRRLKTEHNGAKNGGGYWGCREDAKKRSRKKRRADVRAECAEELKRRGQA